MSTNIVDLVKQALPADLISKFSSVNNESEADTQKGLSALIPTFLLALSSTSKDQFAQIWTTAKNALSGTHETTTPTENVSSSLVSQVFGDKQSGIISAISSYANLKPESTSKLLNTVAPTSINAIGTQTNAESPSGILDFLKSQKEHLSSLLPAGLSLGSLGFNFFNKPEENLPTHGTTVTPSTHNEPLLPTKKSGGFGKILIALIVLALIIYFLSKGCNKGKDTIANTDSTTMHTEPSQSSNASVTHESMKVILPNGQELDAYKGGIEDQLVTFLKTDYKKLGADSLKNVWFNFDNLNFETGSNKITDSSQHQINNIAAILKAFPATKIKIGGYTDKTGDEAANQKLSKLRAEAVKSALDKAGVSAQVTDAEGYGSQYAKFPETAPESDRVTDRHVSVSVRE